MFYTLALCELSLPRFGFMNEKTPEFLTAILSSKHNGIQDYFFAFLLAVVALTVDQAIGTESTELHYLIFFPAVTLSAIGLSLGPALFTVALSLFASSFTRLFPYFSFANAFNEWQSHLIFLVASLVVCFSVEAMDRYRARCQRQTAESLKTDNQFQLQLNIKPVQQIFNNSFSYVALLDDDAMIREVNGSALQHSRLQRKHLIGKHFCSIPWWSYDPSAETELNHAIEAIKQGRLHRSNLTVTMGEGRTPIDFQISRVVNENNQLIGILATGIDISFYRQTETLLKRHHIVVNTAHDGFWMNDMEGNLLEANQAYAEISGYSIDELKRMHISQLEANEHKEQIRAHIEKIINQGYDQFETRHKHKQGHLIDLEISVNYMTETQQFFAFIRDISERKQTEEKLRRAKQLMDSIVDNIPAMVFLKRADDLRFELINRTGAELLGSSADDLIGKNDYDFFPREQADALTSRDRQVFASSGIEEIPEEVIKTTNGENRYLYTRKVALRDSAGQPEYLLGVSLDITERKKAEEELRIAAATFETHEAIMVTDVEGNIIRVNQAFERITGFSSQEVVGKNPRILSSGRHDKEFYARMWQQILTEGNWEGEIWDRRKNGEIYPKWLKITALTNDQGETSEFIGIFSDITDRKQAEDEIRNLAFYDPLTQLPNRRLLLERFNLALSASERTGLCGAILFLDMDKFKTLNDTLGHNYGDLMLSEVAKRIKSNTREIDTVARLGGDEFVVLIEEIGKSNASKEASRRAAIIAEKIRGALASPYLIKGHEHHSSPSIGVCLFSGHSKSVDELLKHADLAMYQARNSGRNAVRFFDPVLQQSVETRAKLEADLHYGLSDQQFRIYYQIQVNNHNFPIGAEALIRWQHPDRGLVSPGEFIPVAEESTLILEIGDWVLEQACIQLMKWSGNELTNHLHLAVNVSAHQFRRHDFVESVAAKIENYQINASLLKLELTESVVLNDMKEVINKMYALRELGIKLSLDDFGTGYSSLSYLKKLPLTQLKIDQSFVRDITSDPNDAIMVRTIIDLAKNFGLNVIAEGVETEEHLAFLKKNGCVAYQGYFFSKPVPIDEFEKQLNNFGLNAVHSHR